MKAARARDLLLWLLAVGSAFALGFFWNRLETRAPHSAADMAQAVGAALADPDAVASLGGLAHALKALTPENLPGAVEALEARRATTDDVTLRLFANAWAGLDAEAAFRHVDREWPRRSQRTVALEEIVAVWADADPVAAAQAVEGLPHSEWVAKESTMRRLVDAWALAPDASDVTEYVASLVPSGFRRELTDAIARQRFERDGAEGLIRWANAIPDDAHASFKRTAFRAAAQLLASAHRREAAAWVEAHAQREYVVDAERIVAVRWARSEPQAALDWLLARPAGAVRDGALATAFGGWRAEESDAAERWLIAATLPDETKEALLERGAPPTQPTVDDGQDPPIRTRREPPAAPPS